MKQIMIVALLMSDFLTRFDRDYTTADPLLVRSKNAFCFKHTYT